MYTPFGEPANPNFIAYSMKNMWFGFAKIHLSNPQDCLDLLRRKCPFIIHLKDKSFVILKIKEAFEISTVEERLAIFAQNNYIEGTTQEQNKIPNYHEELYIKFGIWTCTLLQSTK